MNLSFRSLLLTLLLPAALSNAITFPLRRVKSRPHPSPPQKRSGGGSFSSPHVFASIQGSNDDNSINNIQDIIYLTNITVGGAPYVVQLDTGSSDLWIKGPDVTLPGTRPTSINVNLTYATGWAAGVVSYGPVEFAGINISSQAFVAASSAVNPALTYNANGIAGLGFTSLSIIDSEVNKTGSSDGKSMLYNAFAKNPQEPNFVAFSLQRASDPEDEVEGAFSIGEVEPQYAAVLNKAPIPTFPQHTPTRWNVLLERFIANGQAVSVSSGVAGAPSNRAVVMLDTGTTYSYTTPEISRAIYGGIPGATYDSSSGYWTVPCDVEIDMAIQINGVMYPLHPLDITSHSFSDPAKCTGSFVSSEVSINNGDDGPSFDWILGDNVLRSVYAVYDFGDFDSSGSMGDPYVKLLPLIDPDEASVDFHNVRGGTPKTNITYTVVDVPLGQPVVNVNANTFDQLTQTLAKFDKLYPALIAILGLNALVLLLLLIAGGVYLWRKRTRGVRRRVGLGRALTPMPGPRSFSQYGMPSTETHVYQPVSMALTEDTFVPPSPAFSRADKFQPDRPKSVA